MTNREQVYELVRRATVETGGPIDVLVNNAGIVSGKTLLEVADGLAEKTVQVNTIAHFWTVKAVLPSMMERNTGHICTIASAAGLSGVPGLADYCASKFGAVGFNEAIRLELQKLNRAIATTCVCPFYISTGMFAGAKGIPYVLEIQDPTATARRIFNGIRRKEKIVYIPPILGYAQILRAVLPVGVSDALMHALGITKSMDEFAGRGQDFHLAAGNKSKSQ